MFSRVTCGERQAKPSSSVAVVSRPPESTSATSLAVEDTDRMRWVTRLTLAGVIAAVVLAVIGGFPFDTPMPTHAFGWVEPTCGLTRGSTAIARGDFATAWHYNPASFLVMGFGLLGIARTIAGFTTHRWVNVAYRPGRLTWTLAAVAFFGLWAYQQTNADFIINARV